MSDGMEMLDFAAFSDDRGLIKILDPLPFVPRRMFIIHDVPENSVRGEHAHRNCTQLLVCLNGSFRIWTEYAGVTKTRIMLPYDAVLCPPLTWIKTEEFSDAQYLVLADKTYEECDTISDYAEYLKETSG